MIHANVVGVRTYAKNTAVPTSAGREDIMSDEPITDEIRISRTGSAAYWQRRAEEVEAELDAAESLIEEFRAKNESQVSISVEDAVRILWIIERYRPYEETRELRDRIRKQIIDLSHPPPPFAKRHATTMTDCRNQNWD